jgi:hypothetical protein
MKKVRPMPDAEYLHQRLAYSVKDGSLRWRPRKAAGQDNHWDNTFAGRLAGSLNARGYPQLSIDGCTYTASRVIWTMFMGDIPHGFEVENIDGDRSNTRLNNLRLVSHQVQPKHFTTARVVESGPRAALGPLDYEKLRRVMYRKVTRTATKKEVSA